MRCKAFGNKPGGGFGKHEDPRSYAQVNERFLECSKCGFQFDEDARDQGLDGEEILCGNCWYSLLDSITESITSSRES